MTKIIANKIVFSKSLNVIDCLVEYFCIRIKFLEKSSFILRKIVNVYQQNVVDGITFCKFMVQYYSV